MLLTTIPDITPCYVLQTARKQGDFLLVGLHADEDITERRGPHLPLMDLHERSLSVLACKYVDEVVIGAPPPSAKSEAASRRPTMKVESAPLSVPSCKDMDKVVTGPRSRPVSIADKPWNFDILPRSLVCFLF